MVLNAPRGCACFVVVRFKTGLFRKFVIDRDGTLVHFLDDNADLDIRLPDGWR
jgi:hypothetical protein